METVAVVICSLRGCRADGNNNFIPLDKSSPRKIGAARSRAGAGWFFIYLALALWFPCSDARANGAFADSRFLSVDRHDQFVRCARRRIGKLSTAFYRRSRLLQIAARDDLLRRPRCPH